MRTKGVIIALIIMLISVCSLEYQEAMVADNIEETVPDTIVIDFRHVVVQQGRIIATLEAQRAETYGKKHETILTGVRFYEHDGTGEIVTEGRADRAVFHSNSENAEMSGNILFQSESEGIRIIAENLRWLKDEKKLASAPGQFVRLEKEDGSFVEGKGFSADFKTKSIRFLSEVKGLYVQED